MDGVLSGFLMALAVRLTASLLHTAICRLWEKIKDKRKKKNR